MNHREMTAMAADPPRLRALADSLLKHGGEDLGDGTRRFLADLASYDGSRRLNVAALEALYDIRDKARRFDKLGRYRVADLVRKAWMARLDLNDDEAEEWLVQLHEAGERLIVRRGEALRLLQLARSLDLIPEGEWIEL